MDCRCYMRERPELRSTLGKLVSHICYGKGGREAMHLISPDEHSLQFLKKIIVFQIIAFDELRTDFKSPIDQCNPVHAVSTAHGLLSNSC